MIFGTTFYRDSENTRSPWRHTDSYDDADMFILNVGENSKMQARIARRHLMAIEITYRGSCVGTRGIMKTARMAIAGSWSDTIATYDDIQGILVMSGAKAQIVYKAIKRRLVRIFRLKIVLLKMIGQN